MRRPPKTCPGCGSRPVAYRQAVYCYSCRPYGASVPPPCRICRSDQDYYSGGLCRICHPAAGAPAWIGGPGSCLDCLGWGLHPTGTCSACRDWRRRHDERGTCQGCGRFKITLQRGCCRLCWKHASFSNPDPHAALDPVAAGRHGQQLFLTFALSRTSLLAAGPPPSPKSAWKLAPPRFRVDRGEPAHPDQPVLPGMPQVAGIPPIGVPDPDVLAELFGHAERVADQRGWAPRTRAATRSGLRLVLAHHRLDTCEVAASDVSALADHYGIARVGRARVLDVLADAGLLIDNRAARPDRWRTRHAAHLPERIREEFTLWFRVLARGHPSPPRSRARKPETVVTYAEIVLPAVAYWAICHASLREVDADDVCAWLDRQGPEGNAGRHLTAFRSLFSILRRHKRIFTDPTRRIRIDPRRNLPLPADMNALRAVLAESTARTAAATALVAYHALTLAQLRALETGDVHGQRLRVADLRILLADPVLLVLRTWLSERHRRWPSTANPHLFITEQTAATVDQPTTLGWLQSDLRRHGLTARGLREDRILEEIRTTGGDIRRAQALFGLSDKAAYRYLAVLDGSEYAIAAAATRKSAS